MERWSLFFCPPDGHLTDPKSEGTSLSKVDFYLDELKERTEWIPYLLAESGLPGPRGNIELARAVAILGKQPLFDAFLTLGPVEAPVNTQKEFLVFCGTLGLGRLEAEGEIEGLTRLRILASDPRWRVREAVAMALQTIGRADIERLLKVAREWAKGDPLERRAAVAGVCQPELLDSTPVAVAALEILEVVTTSLHREPDRNAETVRTLRKGLGYCWSVAIVAEPDEGFRRFDSLLDSEDADIRWIVRENLKKKRLQRIDPDRVEELRVKL